MGGTVGCLPTGTISVLPLSLPREADPAHCITQAPWLSGVLSVFSWKWQVENRKRVNMPSLAFCLSFLFFSLSPAHIFPNGPLRFWHLNHLGRIVFSARPLIDTNSNQLWQTGNGLEQWGWIPNLWDHNSPVWILPETARWEEGQGRLTGTDQARPSGLLLYLMRRRRPRTLQVGWPLLQRLIFNFTHQRC